MPGHTIVKGLAPVPGKLMAKQTYYASRTAASHKVHGLHQRAFAHTLDARHRESLSVLRASLSSLGLGTEDKEEDESRLPSVPEVCKDIE